MSTNINFIKSLGIGNETRITLPSLDPATKSYLAATGITGTTQVTAINNLVTGLKADGLWSKMKAVYPFVTDNRNLLSYTEDFSNVFWGKQDSTVVSNSTIAPNGTLTADTVIDNTVNSYHGIIMTDNINATSGITYTSTIYAKYNGRNIQLTYDTGQFGAAQYANFDLQNGVLGSVLGGTATITSAGNGWYRCSFSRAATSTGTGNRIYTLLINSLSATRAQSFIGDAVSGAFIWGIQLEQSVTPTTYQPIATTQQAYIAAQFKYNLVNPVDSDAAFRLVFNGGWTHSSTGATPNGTNGYADTKFNPNTQLTFTNAHISMYKNLGTIGVTDKVNGVYDTGANTIDFSLSPDRSTVFYSNGALGSYIPDTAVGSSSSVQGNGFYVIARNANNFVRLTKNNTNTLTNTTTSSPTAFPNDNMWLGATHAVSNASVIAPNNYRYAMFTLGQYLDATEAANLYTRVQTYQTTLSRQI